MRDLKDIREVGTAKGSRMLISLNQIVFNAEDGVNSREFVIKDQDGDVVEYIYVNLCNYTHRKAKTPAGINDYSFAVLNRPTSIDIMCGMYEINPYMYDEHISDDNFEIFEDMKLYNAYVELINTALKQIK